MQDHVSPIFNHKPVFYFGNIEEVGQKVFAFLAPKREKSVEKSFTKMSSIQLLLGTIYEREVLVRVKLSYEYVQLSIENSLFME